MTQAIITKKVGNRVEAKCESYAIVCEWDDSLYGWKNHRNACNALCAKLDKQYNTTSWTEGEKVAGGYKRQVFHVFTANQQPQDHEGKK